MAELIVVHLPPGPEGLQVLLPPLRAALAGDGPAIAPVPAPDAVGRQYLAALIKAVAPEQPVDSEVSVVVATSGSTGDPAAVALSRSNLTAAAVALQQWRAHQAGQGGPLRWLASLPLHSIGGLMTVVRSLVAGQEPVAAPWLGGAATFRAEDLVAAGQRVAAESPQGVGLGVSLVPTMVQRLAAAGLAAAAGSVLDLLLVGGAPAQPETLRLLRESGCNVVNSYGMTETAGGAVFNGEPAPGVLVRTEPSGRLVIAGPMVAGGYRDGRAAQDWSVVSGLPAFRTGDRGEIAADGHVRWIGRIDQVVAVGGVNVDIAAVERLLARQPGVAEAVIVAVADEQWGAHLAGFVVARSDGAPPSVQSLSNVLAQQLGRPAVPRSLSLARSLPRLPSGKPDRVALANSVGAELGSARADLSGTMSQ